MTSNPFFAPLDARLEPHLLAFASALLDRSPDFLFENCAVFGDYAVARRIHLGCSTFVVEKVVLSVENLDDNRKPLAFAVSVDRTLVDGSTRLSFSGLARVAPKLQDEPIGVALDEASDQATLRMNNAIAALLVMQARSRSTTSGL